MHNKYFQNVTIAKKLATKAKKTAPKIKTIIFKSASIVFLYITGSTIGKIKITNICEKNIVKTIKIKHKKNLMNFELLFSKNLTNFLKKIIFTTEKIEKYIR